MEIEKFLKRFLLPVSMGIVSLFFSYTSVYAASGTISVVPAKGTFQNGQTITAAIRIDGGGTAFNAAKANVAVSQNLAVQGLTLGDCDFALVKTPSESSLDFAGVILGGSVDSCTIYTLNLKVQSSGTGFVYISDGSIKSYKGAQELLSTINNSSYTFSGTSGYSNSIVSILTPTPTQPPLALANGIKLYTLVYNISTPGRTPSANMKVTLDQGKPDEMVTTPQPNSNDPSVLAAIFDNVPQGVHSITVLDNDKPVSNQIVNLDGQNREITLGVTPKSFAGSLFWYITIAVILIVIITGGIFAYMMIWKKNHPGTS